ncbi:DUF2309 domain-containing protein [Aureliella helgolandensis]|uniref:Probable inorganic carbon transporter subunit DabA n=1 Tax=Aureliella helgolandensis TaxID=2527968 RepID=A0A518G7E5_9BACT|nr:DUF2309 domain-containing protein [Aureliella helgolandensis]QDV24507.1 hypothetical protein Q31a_28250 [Aureliella helgolandensis]
MHDDTTSSDSSTTSTAGDYQPDNLLHVIEHASHFLPAQGPIEVFVHHNTLHAFEHLPFDQAVRAAWKIYGAQPYMSKQRFRELFREGRIAESDLRTVLHEDLGDEECVPVAGLGSRYDLRLAMLLHPMRTAPEDELRWAIAETDALTRFRDDVNLVQIEQMVMATKESLATETLSEPLQSRIASFGRGARTKWGQDDWEAFTLLSLWDTCDTGVELADRTLTTLERPKRLRDVLLIATGEDPDRFVHEMLIRFTATFIDQGFASWNLPHRDQGYFKAFVALYIREMIAGERWAQGLSSELQKIQGARTTAIASIRQSLRLMGVEPQDYETVITQTLLALPGWAGMVAQLADAPHWVDRPLPKDTLVEFLAVRLLLDRLAAKHVAVEQLGFSGSLDQLSDYAWDRANTSQKVHLQNCFLVFQVAQIMGWDWSTLRELDRKQWALIFHELESFDEVHRRRIFQQAYERKYRDESLTAVALTSARAKSRPHTRRRPSFQIACCLDDREESFRRYLEETDPNCETFGAAGFFAVAMNYQGATDANYKPLCPAIVTPNHFVRENVGYTFAGEHRRRAATRRKLGMATHRWHSRSRGFIGGALTSILGSLAAFPLVSRVLFPRLTAQIRRKAGELIKPPPVTQLQLERYKPDPGPEDGNVGYTVEEMIVIVERLLRDIGLTQTFSRIVVITGHGSSSVNNPHESAYNCGACAGKRGGPNARAFAQMANDWRVRRGVAQNGIVIPDDTTFLGAYHNTCDDSVVWYDLDRMPPSHFDLFETVKRTCDEARLRNAHERARRFESCEIDCTPEEALRHVERRSEDLSQVRPEYNHATDALCFVGQREWSRGLFLDRRAFLTSYEPEQDDAEHSILLRILSAAIPVCAGINLEYYFSAVDNIKYGSGTKLPHNIVSLLGVMEGATSDLRTGLYRQMIEIHEPMRILFVIQTTPEAMLSVMDRHEGIGLLCRGDWIQLAVLDHATSKIQLWHDGKFVPFEPEADQLPIAQDSVAWFRGHRENLPFAWCEAATVSDENAESESLVASGMEAGRA